MTDRYDLIPFDDEAEPNLQFIIPIFWEKFHDETLQTANLRDLHKWLEVATPFHKWISRRIDEYNFVDGTDFWTHLSKTSSILSETSSEEVGGRPRQEYRGTLDMCKELSMVERTVRGKQARSYFIQCEKIAKYQLAYDKRASHLDSLSAEILKARPQWRKLLRYHRLGLSQGEMAKLLGVTQRCVWKHLARMKACGLIETTKAPPLPIYFP